MPLFSVFKAVILNPLPYPDPESLVWLSELDGADREIRASLPDVDDWRRRATTLRGLAAYADAPILAAGGASPERVKGVIVTEGFFEVLRVPPHLGRVFHAEDHNNAPALGTVILGYGLWQRTWGGDPSVIGRRITLMGLPSTVVGVMPPGFAFPPGAELWVSGRALAEGNARTAHNYWAIGRTNTGVTLSAADAEIREIARLLKRQYPGDLQSPSARVVSLNNYLVGSTRTPLLALLSAVGVLLLIVCVNVANLLLVRGAAREQELTIRAALGADRKRIFSLLLSESLALAFLGGAAGFLISLWSIDLVRILLPAGLPRGGEIEIDAGVAWFAIGITAGAGLLFGTFPAWRSAGLSLQHGLRLSAKTASRSFVRLQSALVISEVSLCVILLGAAGLLATSFVKLRAVNPGFRDANVMLTDLSFPALAVPRLVPSYDDLVDSVRSLPGVVTAGVIKDVPLDPVQRSGHFFIEGQAGQGPAEAGFLVAGPGYFSTLGIPIIEGRDLEPGDVAGVEAVAVISAEMARRFFPHRTAIGNRIWFDGFEPKPVWRKIVGVAGDVHQEGLMQSPGPQAYIAYAQAQVPAMLLGSTVAIRTAPGLDPQSIVPAIRKRVAALNLDASVTFRQLPGVLSIATARHRFQAQVLGVLAILAGVLAMVGVYGVLSYYVTANRASLGIRIALGAQRRDILHLVGWRAARLIMTGAAIGLAGCLGARDLLSKLVYGIGPSDPLTLGLVLAALGVAGLIACWLPARRATELNPLDALRQE